MAESKQNKTGQKSAEDKRTEEQADGQNESSAAPTDPTYHIDRLVNEAEQFFGVASHVVAGALSGERKQNFTRNEVETAVQSWLRQDVTTDEA